MTKKITAKETLAGVLSLFKKTVAFLKGDRARSFFLGYYYPAVVIAFAFISHISSLEWLFCALILIPTFFAVLFYDSIIPLITPACCLAMHIARDDANGAVNPASADFYLSRGGIVFLVLMLILIVGSIGAFFFLRWKRGRLKLKLREVPLLLPTSLLTLALLLNGVFAEGYTFNNLFIGFFEALTLFFFFYVFYFGLKGENYEELIDKFCYISALVAILLSLQVGWLYLTDEFILNDLGHINKGRIAFGWGCSNNAGSMLGVAIPACFLGLMRKPKHAWFYFTVATVAGIASIATLSRNALLIVTAIYILSFAITMFFGGAKKFSRIAFPATMAVIAGVLIACSESIRRLFNSYYENGMSDNGRYALWKTAIPAFLSAPIFGRGFFGIDTLNLPMTAFVPPMLHCTPFQLIASTGAFGLGSYIYYRVMTFIRLFRRISLVKIMLALCVGVILVGSLLDNFIFYMQQMIHPSIALAIMYLADENRENS